MDSNSIPTYSKNPNQTRKSWTIPTRGFKNYTKNIIIINFKVGQKQQKKKKETMILPGANSKLVREVKFRPKRQNSSPIVWRQKQGEL